MKNKSVKLVLVISLSLLLVVAFYNETYADISRYNWEFPHPPVKMIPVKEGMCALTGMAGKFRGGAEQVYVFQSGNNWFLGGQTMQGYIWAQAHCIKYKDFGKDYANIRYSGQSDWLGCNENHCAKHNISVFYSQACKAVFLQAVSGDFERPSLMHAPTLYAGYVTTQEGYNALGVSVWGRGIQVESGKYFYKTMRGKLGCLMGNVPDMKNERINWERKGAEFKIPQNKDIKTNYNASSYFCLMGDVKGYFHGGGERVNLAINSKGEWILQGQTMQTYSSMFAWCFRYK